MHARSHLRHTSTRTTRLHRFLRAILPHPHATVATFATFIATFAASCHPNRPPSPMNPGITLAQNQKTAKTAMPLSCPIPLYLPPWTSPSSPSSVSSVFVLVSIPVWHGRLTCDPPDAYSTGAIWGRLPNLACAPPHERAPAPVITTAADRPDNSIEEPPWLFAPS